MSGSSITLVIAGLPIRLECEDTRLLERLARRYADFLVSATEGFSVKIDWQLSGSQPDGCDYPPVAFVDGILQLQRPDYRGEICLGDGRARLAILTQRPEEDVDYFLRLACACLAFGAGGLMLHSAGIVRNDFAHIFFGKSGSGKTTVARLSVDGLVLNDDLVVLMPGSNGWLAHATPFTNATQVPPHAASAPVAGLFRLVQDQKVYLDEMSRAAALAELIASAPVVASDPHLAGELIERCKSLAEACPIYNLHFRKNPEFWQIIENRDQY